MIMYNENLHTTESLATLLNLSIKTIISRCKTLDIKPKRKSRSFVYTEDQADKLINYKKKVIYKNKIDPKTRFSVIEMFLMMEENTCRNISEASGISFSTVNYIINDYLNNDKSIVIESEMNYLTD